ncbi:MAG TPA: molybdopterin-dependent oxidoreductase, partial [Bacteroidales bacterium]|nr:molybdopterin-dependent oxidoreductase [Bacteroidales bacterium]
ETIETLAIACNLEMNAIILFSEKELPGNAVIELTNFALLTGKLGKTASGILSLKEKNNAQGLFDMGVNPLTGIGGQSLADPGYLSKCSEVWQTQELTTEPEVCLPERLERGQFRNLFIFGEDPIGCATDPAKYRRILSQASFIVVQDYFQTPTALAADLVLPDSFPAETGGTFTNTRKVIQGFEAVMTSPLEFNSMQQLASLIRRFGFQQSDQPHAILTEFIALLPVKTPHENFSLRTTEETFFSDRFNHGCDAIVKQFDEEVKW